MDSSVTIGKKGLSGSTLKIIAMIAMLIDHSAASILEKMLMSREYLGTIAGNNVAIGIYMALRIIGRIAFPIYIFLLVQGFDYTRSKFKYLLRLIMFAFISEIPFDDALIKTRRISDFVDAFKVEFSYQNVFFTLALGFAALIIIDAISNVVDKMYFDIKIKFVLRLLVAAVFAVIFGWIALKLRTDYDFWGVLAIVVMYFFRKKKKLSMALTCVALSIGSVIELCALVDIIFVHKYNGTKGVNVKWLFYLFYPVHLAILAVLWNVIV